MAAAGGLAEPAEVAEVAEREEMMRAVGWVLGGGLVGVAAGLAAGLLRRCPSGASRAVEARSEYAGGYAAPVPSSDRAVAGQAYESDAPPPGRRAGADAEDREGGRGPAGVVITEQSRTTPNG